MTFQPHEFGDPYTKRTCLWGDFNADLPKKEVEPTEGSRMWNLPPSADRASLRSKTPEGFAKAFCQANRLQDGPKRSEMTDWTKFRTATVAALFATASERG